MKEKDMIQIEITGLSSEGEGIGRIGPGGENFVVFVPGSLPGERVNCRVERVSKNYAAASVAETLSVSPDRTTPKCPGYGRCGGCQLQHLSYEAQVRFKRETLADAMRRIGHIDIDCEIGCFPSPAEWGYRNKTVLPVGRGTGYYEKRSHRIVEFDVCPALDPSLERAVKGLIAANASSGLRGYDERKKDGDIRGVAARIGDGGILTGTVVARELAKRELGRLRDVHQKMMSGAREISGSVLNIKPQPDNFVWGPVFKTLCGNGTLTAGLGHYKFGVDISSFFQINAPQAERIFERAAFAASQAGASKVLELYSGVGSLTAYLAGVAGSVDAVEEWRPAARLMRENMERNGIGGVKIFEDSSERFLGGGHALSYDTVVLDPPRAGASEAVINGVLGIAPQNIIYISCNPATLARDAARVIGDGRYRVASLDAYDMFPQTSHVESLCVLTRV
ncbi:MAG: 23S rRNA (uracil(1939)-C(5))-methyltransferase RlmD [Synergistaceae bacterium]|nr:23S rRNA (uracil(1939)-C(5))-methyltransferase RlmD [Synergistaceae bacterium]